jgi:hypothetical protein
VPLLASSPHYIGVGSWFREPIEPGAGYDHRAFTNVVMFHETEMTELSTGGRYGRAMPMPMVAKLVDAFVFWTSFFHTNSNLGVLRLVELIWTRATTSLP